jgi:hypothetical protein
MNNKFKEIAREATEWCEKNAVGTPVAWEWEEKFAELIIKECISKALEERVDEELIVVESNGTDKAYFRGNNGGIIDAVCAIKLHFELE